MRLELFFRALTATVVTVTIVATAYRASNGHRSYSRNLIKWRNIVTTLTTTQNPTTTTRTLTTTSERPPTTTETPSTISEVPTTASETPTTTSETPTTTSEKPTTTTEIPTTTSEKPTTTTEIPTTTSEKPTTTTEIPTTTSEKSTTTTEIPTTTSEAPTTTSEKPTTTTEVPQPHQYYFSAHSFTWNEGRDYCKNVDKSSSLAVFESKKQYKDAVKYVEKCSSGVEEFWVGGMYKKKRWVWITGTPVNLSMSLWSRPCKPNNNSRLAVAILDHMNSRWTCLDKTISRKVLCQMNKITQLR